MRAILAVPPGAFEQWVRKLFELQQVDIVEPSILEAEGVWPSIEDETPDLMVLHTGISGSVSLLLRHLAQRRETWDTMRSLIIVESPLAHPEVGAKLLDVVQQFKLEPVILDPTPDKLAPMLLQVIHEIRYEQEQHVLRQQEEARNAQWDATTVPSLVDAYTPDEPMTLPDDMWSQFSVESLIGTADAPTIITLGDDGELELVDDEGLAELETPATETFEDAEQDDMEATATETFEDVEQDDLEAPATETFEDVEQNTFEAPATETFEDVEQDDLEAPATETFEDVEQDIFEAPAVPEDPAWVGDDEVVQHLNPFGGYAETFTEDETPTLPDVDLPDPGFPEEEEVFDPTPQTEVHVHADQVTIHTTVADPEPVYLDADLEESANPPEIIPGWDDQPEATSEADERVHIVAGGLGRPQFDSDDELIQTLRAKSDEIQPGYTISKYNEEDVQADRLELSSRVITVFGAKGGVGKTTTAANLMAILNKVTGRGIGLDFNVMTPHLGTLLGVDEDKPGLKGISEELISVDSRNSTPEYEALHTETLTPEIFKRYLVSAFDNKILPGAPASSLASPLVTEELVRSVIDVARNMSSIVVIDTTQFIEDVPTWVSLLVADIIVVVTNTTELALKETYRAIYQLKQAGIPERRLRVIVNQTLPKGLHPLKEIEKIIGHEVLVGIPSDNKAYQLAEFHRHPVALKEPPKKGPWHKVLFEVTSGLADDPQLIQETKKGLFGRKKK